MIIILFVTIVKYPSTIFALLIFCKWYIEPLFIYLKDCKFLNLLKHYYYLCCYAFPAFLKRQKTFLPPRLIREESKMMILN